MPRMRFRESRIVSVANGHARRASMTGTCIVCGAPCAREGKKCWDCKVSEERGPTPHNLRALQKLADTGSIKEAADVLGVSHKTIECHLAMLRAKLKNPGMSLHSLIAWGFRTGTIVCLMFLAFPVMAQKNAGGTPPTGYVTLGWNPSSSTNVVLYNVYFGPQGGSFTNHAITSQTNITLRLPKGPYSFGATALDKEARESILSNVVGWTVKPNSKK